MVSRKTGWRIVTLAAALYAAASADGPSTRAMDRAPPIPPADIPNVSAAPSSERRKPARRSAPVRSPAPAEFEPMDAPVEAEPLPPAQTWSSPPVESRAAGRLVWGGALPEADSGYVPSPAYEQPGADEDVAPARRAAPRKAARRPAAPPPEWAEPPERAEPVDAAPEQEAAPGTREDPGPGNYGRTYPVRDLSPQRRSDAEPVDEPPVREASLAPSRPPEIVDDGGAGHGAEPDARFDPWEGLTDAEPANDARVLASLPAYAPSGSPRTGGMDRPGLGVFEREVPEGYRPLAASEAMCRRELKRLGVVYRDVSRVATGGACGIDHPVRVSQAVAGIAMSPPATMNCAAALRVARWLRDDVKPAARWKLWKRPTALINASSYRCSRIAGSRTISEHAGGNALDVGGFRFADGSTVRVEPKGAFSFRERAFQTAIRTASCRHFGTVLGPGYNRAHADHLHLDVKTRLRPVCK
ncbi:extensin family protein [Aureimonas pseudogalii]|uniref:Extensin-like C-terminal domain-containing protein n=1 Tax=Aureimonas pseudogalii TaxID=1744844 RepID=A0A7W6EBS6_9HYPH|nr:extensin family protein [Aureimonas pseudogalii]MBB3996342.1 hypothetical protein [Aureimonas pseudogalii]